MQQQSGQKRNEKRFLELETPAENAARRTQGEQHARENPEGDQHAGSKSVAMTPDCGGFVVGDVNEAEHLERQHGEDARHQVEDDNFKRTNILVRCTRLIHHENIFLLKNFNGR